MRTRPLIGTLTVISMLALSIGTAGAGSSGDRSWRGDREWHGDGRHDDHARGHDRGRGERWASSRWHRDDRDHGSRHRHADRDDDDDDDDVFAMLAIAGLTLVTLGMLSQTQQQSFESAQTRATIVPLGESVVWQDGTAHGSVTPVREGRSSFGRHCREFQKTVTIGGRQENAYGTACRDADGAWEVVSPPD